MNRDQINAVLMALHGDTLLLPNSAVAEVIARERAQPQADMPGWFAGFCDWNNRRVPVLGFEQLNGAAAVPPSRRARIVIVHAYGRHETAGALGFVTQGYPHLVTLNRAALQPSALRETDRADLVLSRVRISSQEALIPDIACIESEIARLAPSQAI